MKKTYIKPETIVAAINVKAFLLVPSVHNDKDAETDQGYNDGDGLARETVRSGGAWEEW